MKMRIFQTICGSAILAGTALAQLTESRAAFEVADIHTSPQTRNAFFRRPSAHAGRYETRYATMADLISTAYGINASEVLGGPSWLEWDQFDIIAKLPARSTAESQKEMLKSLLADRFGVVVHSDMKPMPALALTVGKKNSMKPSTESGEPDCRFVPPPPSPPGQGRGGGEGGAPAPPTFGFDCRNMTMAKFAEEVRDMVNTDDKPIIDHTGLEGAWDFSFKFSGGFRSDSGSDPIVEAIEKQVGIKLEQVKTPVPVLIVDKANRVPTANLPDVAQILHEVPPPTEFDVADLKPSDPSTRGIRFQIQNGGRINAQATVKFMVQQAWNVTPDMILGAPKWMDDDRYDIIAKAPAEAGREIDIDTLWVMLRNLLKERFKLEAHLEDRMVNAYTLVAVKPKMQKSDPTSRTKYKEGTGNDGKDPRNKNPILSRLVTVQNMTMAQFAAKLQQIAPGYIHAPVLDATGLEGSYDFTLSFSPAGAAQNGGRGGGRADGPAAAGISEASDPSGAITLPEAIERTLGLKLELQKRMAPCLVIDHIEQKPVEN